MSIGKLIERVTIQQRTNTPDSHGGRSVSWSTFATVWATVTALTAAERIEAGEVTTVAAYTVTIRARADLSATMRLSWRPYGAAVARTLQINGMRLVDGDRDWLELDAVEVQA